MTECSYVVTGRLGTGKQMMHGVVSLSCFSEQFVIIISISVCNQLPRPTQPGHLFMGRRNLYWRWFRPPLGKNSEFYVTVGSVTRTTGMLA